MWLWLVLSNAQAQVPCELTDVPGLHLVLWERREPEVESSRAEAKKTFGDHLQQMREELLERLYDDAKLDALVAPGDLVAIFPEGVEARHPITRNPPSGGHGAVYQVGPKDMRVECHGCPLADIAYVRNGWAGMFESTLELLAKKVYVREQPRYRSDTTCAFHIAWV